MDRYKLLSGSVLPRPIALVTSVDAAGHPNAAPFSFFGVLSHDPPVIALGIENRPDGSRKDTARNIDETGEFTVHIPNVALLRQVEICAAQYSPGVNELDLADLPSVAGQAVGCPRITTAPVALECKLKTKVELGSARQIVIGEVVGLFVRADAVNDRLHIDPRIIDAIGRLGGPAYASTRDQLVTGQ
nr:flavin reductase family protein [Rhizobium rhizoryzae]